MFMSPPDIGNTVLCCFPDGKLGDGYWFACISPYLSRSMIPANGAEPLDKIDPESIPQELKSRLKPQGYYPTGEFNDNATRSYVAGWFNQIKKPIHPQLAEQYINQGLDRDPLRGPISSSVTRDPVSGVFGFNTPGRPLADPASTPEKSAELKDRLLRGDFTADEFDVGARQGGHSFVMDDGDFFGNSRLTRWRSASGHQILMSDNVDEQFIYISNATGDSWVELSPGGEVLVYSRRGINMRSQGPIQFHSDSTVNINGEYVSIFGKNGVAIDTESSVKIRGDDSVNIYGKKYVTALSGGDISLNGSTATLSATGQLTLLGRPIKLNSGGGSRAPVLEKLQQHTQDDAVLTNGSWEVSEQKFTSLSSHVPTHEPYRRQTIRELQDIILSQNTGSRLSRLSQAEKVATIERKIPESSVEEKTTREYTPHGLAPESAFRNQPQPASGLGILSQVELQAYFAQTGHRESNMNYRAINTIGFVGKYQFGAAALIDAGYVKRIDGIRNADLKNPSVWLRGYSLEKFLADPQAQEDAMYKYTQANYTTLKRIGCIDGSTSREDVAGLLSAAHLKGAGGARELYIKGNDTQDAYGTKASNYFANGVYSQRVIAPKLAQAQAEKARVA
jgi:hypothetical protein